KFSKTASPENTRHLPPPPGARGLSPPPHPPATRNGSPPSTERGRQWLAALLAGQIDDLEPVPTDLVEVFDSALDETQREAVARALHTPDLCLIQGLPGTGKSRVVAELVTQAAARGERILLLAPTAVAVD